MAIYHCSVKPVKRSKGRSATAAAAYRSGGRIEDEQSGKIHDYTRRTGVESATLILPEGITIERAALWNAAEAAERRQNAQVAREVEIALPDELNTNQRQELAHDFARYLVKRYQVAADVCIHAPGKEGDQRNHHAHILLTTRKIQPDGRLGDKTRILDDRQTGPQEIEAIRKEWERSCNQALSRAGHAERIDHRTLAAQYKAQHITFNPDMVRPATVHLGPKATAMERRGESTRKGAVNALAAEIWAIDAEMRERQNNPQAALMVRLQAALRAEAEWERQMATAKPPADLAEAIQRASLDASIKFHADLARKGEVRPKGHFEERKLAKAAEERVWEEWFRPKKEEKRPQHPQEQEAERSNQTSRDDDEWER